MEFQFEMPEGYRKEDLLALCRLQYRKTAGRLVLFVLMRVLLVALGVFLLVPGCMIVLGVSTDVSKLQGVLWILVGLAALSVGIFRDRVNALRSRRMLREDMGAIEMTFTEEEVQEKTNGVDARIRYSMFLDLYRFRDWWFLYVQKNRAYVLPVGCLCTGTPEEFEAFITQKTGLPVKVRK